MMHQFETYVEKYHMIETGDFVVAGVSGGADSVCLLSLLFKYQKKKDFSLEVVHINHLMRDEAGEDAAYVKSLCQKWNIPFHLVTQDVQALAKEWGMSSEEAGRKVRYDAFREVIKQHPEKTGKIAVAHNKNDRGETVLFNLFRGTGSTGLIGIKPVNDDIIRPLLCFSRNEIEAYLKKENISYCIDKTNSENLYSRNKIRNNILPFVEEEINPNVLEHLNKTAELMALQESYLQKKTQEALKSCLLKGVEKEGKEAVFYVPEFCKQEELLQARMLLQVFSDLVPGRKDITSAHIESIRELFYKEGEKKLSLPYGMEARKEYEKLFLRMQQKETEEKKELEYGELVKTRVFFKEKGDIIPEKPYTKWFDYDKINGSLVVRTRKSGDYLIINDKGQKKSLKDYFINEKIPQSQRDKVLLVADGSHIVWVIGKRISEYYKVEENTKTILEIHFASQNK